MARAVEGIFHNLSATHEDLAPTRKPAKRKRVAFNTKGRKKSKNIEDRRAYFGSHAHDPGYYHEDARDDFVRDTLRNPYPDAPQEFKKRAPLTLEGLLNVRAGEKDPRGLDKYMGVMGKAARPGMSTVAMRRKKKD